MYNDTVSLEKQLDDLCLVLDKQISVLAIKANQMGIDPSDMQHSDGSWPLANLLAAKAQALHSLIILKGNSTGFQTTFHYYGGPEGVKDE